MVVQAVVQQISVSASGFEFQVDFGIFGKPVSSQNEHWAFFINEFKDHTMRDTSNLTPKISH